MSDLQLGLVALGAIIIAAVILFNWWQERRFSRESIRRFEGPVDDALLEEFRIDTDAVVAGRREAVFTIERAEDGDYPGSEQAFPDETPFSEPLGTADVDEGAPFDPEPPARTPEPQVPDRFFNEDEGAGAAESAAEPVPALRQAAPSVARTQDRALPETVDPQIDLLALVDLDLPRSGATLMKELQTPPEFDKSCQWLGLDDTGAWCRLTREQESATFSRIGCSIQLADRSGAISSDTLRRFRGKVDHVASELGGRIEWHDHGDAYRYGQELDQFCVEVDVMVGFHVVQGVSGPFAGTKLRGLLEAGGMRLGEDGNFHFRAESGEPLFMLINQDQRPFSPETLRTAFIRGVTFQLDVPRVKNCTETFNQMVMLARQMENGLGGRLIDDNQRPLGDAEIDKIRQQLKIIYSRMVARGIIPGSATANRLFS